MAARGLELFPGFTDLVFEQAHRARARRRRRGRASSCASASSSATRRPSTPRSSAPARSSPRTRSRTCCSSTARRRGRRAARAHRRRAPAPRAGPAPARLRPRRDRHGHHRPAARQRLPLLAAVLDALLAAIDIDGFVALRRARPSASRASDRASATSCSPHVPRRGFVDSAAEEWAAACEEHGPDAAALDRPGPRRRGPRQPPRTPRSSPRAPSSWTRPQRACAVADVAMPTDGERRIEGPDRADGDWTLMAIDPVRTPLPSRPRPVRPARPARARRRPFEAFRREGRRPSRSARPDDAARARRRADRRPGLRAAARAGRELRFADRPRGRHRGLRREGQLLRAIPPPRRCGSPPGRRHGWPEARRSGVRHGHQTIISQLMAIEAGPKTRLLTQQNSPRAARPREDVARQLRALSTAIADLRSTTTWGDVQAVTTSDATKVAARTFGSAPRATYRRGLPARPLRAARVHLGRARPRGDDDQPQDDGRSARSHAGRPCRPRHQHHDPGRRRRQRRGRRDRRQVRLARVRVGRRRADRALRQEDRHAALRDRQPTSPRTPRSCARSRRPSTRSTAARRSSPRRTPSPA